NDVFSDIAAAPTTINLFGDPDPQKREIRFLARPVTGNYFAVLGITPYLGRLLLPEDESSKPSVAVMTYSCWKRLGADPKIIGKAAAGFTVVGVAPKSFTGSLYGINGDLIIPLSDSNALAQHPQAWVDVIVRTKGDPHLWAGPLARTVRSLGMVALTPATFDTWANLTLFTGRLTADAVGGLSALGLLLAIAGIFGSVSYSAGERKKELGIRAALGARPRQLIQMVLRQTVIVAGSGVLIGTLLGVGATALVRSQLFGIGAVEWIVPLPVAAAMLSVSLIVAYFAARPWASIHPMEAVRHA
ncbi:MAG TPA: FtsX-like permease family protein, partial [Bryobacteraceae bacterium]|nr:FtsX-like permease family protein [Bryobacteraceae bacterium]